MTSTHTTTPETTLSQQIKPQDWLIALFEQIPDNFHYTDQQQVQRSNLAGQNTYPPLPDYSTLFERLEIALQKTPIPLKDKTTRIAKAEEFYCMLHTPPLSRQTIPFKHRDSRNYLYLKPDNTLYIPTGGGFHNGTFDLRFA